MTFDAAFLSSSASELLFFAVWIATGLAALVVFSVLVVRANRSFGRRLVAVESATDAVELDDIRLATAA